MSDNEKPKAKVWAELTELEDGCVKVEAMAEGKISDVLLCLARMVRAVSEDSGMPAPVIYALIDRLPSADQHIAMDPRIFKKGGQNG